ncbi:hypothetical protein QE250_09285 [Chromatiaceae bacterium AAb-1]|nr:hypothetical protein [Chromatiaceae bacterium AAb-1]
MTESSAANRKYRRWYFAADSQPKEVQTNGVAVKLARRSWWFESFICNAVVKDVSLGGAGVLVPSTKTVPDAIVVRYEPDIRIKADVVYRQLVNDKLMFLGLNWESAAHEQRLKLLRKLSKKASRSPQQMKNNPEYGE